MRPVLLGFTVPGPDDDVLRRAPFFVPTFSMGTCGPVAGLALLWFLARYSLGHGTVHGWKAS